MTLTEFTARLDEFRALWVEELLSAEEVGQKMGMSKNSVHFWSKETGLNHERKRSMNAALYQRRRERELARRQARSLTGAYVPPQGNCRECELLQACRDYRTWLFDAGLPCETLLPDEAAAVAGGGYERSELPRRTAMEVILHYEI